MIDICKQFELFGKGIGHRTRFKILLVLFKNRERTVNELVALLKLSQPSISQHLKILKAGGLVVGEKSGQEVHYHIDNKNVKCLLKQMIDGVSYAEKKWKKGAKEA